MKKKYSLDTLPKYVSSEMLNMLTQEEKKELYQQCKKGRTCYVDNEAPYESIYDENGYEHWENIYDY